MPRMDKRERIKAALEEAGISRVEIARRVGVTPQAVNGWLTTGTIATDRLAQVARECRVSLEWLVSGTPSEPGQMPNVVPIVGHAMATPGEDGFFSDMGLPPGGGDGFARWPSRDPSAYALRVKGDSMQPRIRPGELIVIEPNSPVSPGDDVLVKLTDGRRLVKQLLYRRAGNVVLGSINTAHTPVTIPQDEVEALQLVVGIVSASAAQP